MPTTLDSVDTNITLFFFSALAIQSALPRQPLLHCSCDVLAFNSDNGAYYRLRARSRHVSFNIWNTSDSVNTDTLRHRTNDN